MRVEVTGEEKKQKHGENKRRKEMKDRRRDTEEKRKTNGGKMELLKISVGIKTMRV